VTPKPVSLAARFLPFDLLFGGGALAPFVRRHAWALPVIAGLGFFASVLEGASIGILIPLVALLLADAVPAGIPEPLLWLTRLTEPLDTEERVLAIGATILVLITIKGAIQAANAWLTAFAASRVGHDLRVALAARILGLDYAQLMVADPVRLVDIISSDSWEATKVVKWLFEIAVAATALAVFAVLLAWLDWRLFAIVVAGGALVIAALAVVEHRLRRISIEVTAANRLLAWRMATIVAAVRVIRVFGQTAREQGRFDSASQRVDRAMQATERTSSLMGPVVEVLIACLFIAILLAGTRLGVSLAVITAFLVLLVRCQPYARLISELRLTIAAMRGSLLEIEWLLSLAPPPAPPGRSDRELPDAAPIAFEDVSYTYPNGTPGLAGASFGLRPNVSTALIGRSGSGKSTVVNLLCALIEPDGGHIRVGDERLDRADPARWRERLAVAGQDYELLGGTVAENIAYSRPEASRAEIEQVARTAGAHEFICRLPAGYDTEVTGEGLSLSGGQRQRIGLARALLKNADILILDEATNAVDGLSEREIMKLLAEHRNFRTALVVSHRPLTLEACEDGIVLDEGRVVEAGPLRELAYYRRMTGAAG
jgi:subfamily B ATP-binding cassette protein MsbA